MFVTNFTQSYLIIFGEELGEFLMPPLRCFFLGDSAECWSSSTETAKSGGVRQRIVLEYEKWNITHLG